jgi:hypothetical protein
MDWAVFKAGLLHSTWGLDTVVIIGVGCTQQSKKCNDELITQSNPAGIWHHPEPWKYATNSERIGQRMTLCYDGMKGTGDRSNQSSCGEGWETWSAVHRGSPSVARRKKLEAPLSIDQIGTQEIWTIQDNQRSISSGISAEPPYDMGNPWHLPLIIAIALSQDDTTWTKFLLTTSGSNRRRRRIWSWSNMQSLTLQVQSCLTIFGEMVRIPWER